MQAKIETLRAKNANDEEYLVYPRTLVKCVVDENGNNLEDKMVEFIETEFGDHFATKEALDEKADNLTYEGNVLALKSGDTTLSSVEITSGSSGEIPKNVLFAKGVTSAGIETPNLDASTLEGHNAEYFATNESLDTKADNLTYLDNVLSLKSGDDVLSEVTIIGIPSAEVPDNVLFATDDTATDIDAPILDASSLGGHDSNYFATAESVTNIISGTTPVSKANNLVGDFVKGSIKDYLSNLTMQTKSYVLTDTNTTDLPVSGRGVVEFNKRTYDTWVTYFCIENNTIYTTEYDANIGVWYPWKQVATLADLANYLPLTGGKISKNHPTPLQIENITEINFQVFLEFLVNGVSYGHIGFDGVNNPIFRNTDGNYFSILHSGNKPSGSYTGNGSTAERTINIGGTGSVLHIFIPHTGWGALVWRYGALVFGGNTVTELNETAARFLEGKLILNTDHYALNVNGQLHYYEML